MPFTLNLQDERRVFQCPSCKETINTSESRCPFCSAPIDHASATQAAELMSKVNQACSDASYLRIMAGMMLTFFLLRFIPFIAIVGTIGLWFLILAVPVMVFRWMIKFWDLPSAEPDFHRAKRTVKIAAGIWTLFCLILFGLPLLARMLLR